MSILLFVRPEIYTGGVACCLLVSHGEYADGTDRQTDVRTPDRYITLSARRGQRDDLFIWTSHWLPNALAQRNRYGRVGKNVEFLTSVVCVLGVEM